MLSIDSHSLVDYEFEMKSWLHCAEIMFLHGNSTIENGCNSLTIKVKIMNV